MWHDVFSDEAWALKQIDKDYVLAFKSQAPEAQRGLLEWMITLLFYAAMALVIMIWIWPLTILTPGWPAAGSSFGSFGTPLPD